MKSRCTIVCLGVLFGLATTAWAQADPDPVQEMREQIQLLQSKLKALESSSSERNRVTQLGRSSRREEEAEWIVRVYDLSDLFTFAPQYPAVVPSAMDDQNAALFPNSAAGSQQGASGMGGMGGGMGGMGGIGGGMMSGMNGGFMSVPIKTPAARRSAAGPSDTPRTSFDDLIDAITSTIEPTNWDHVGGPGSIAPLGNSLLISATPRMHEAITALMDGLRKRWGTLRTISVQADWLWLGDSQVAALLASQGEKPAEPRAFGLVNDAAWDSLVKELRQAGDKHQAGYRAVITCYNGQTVHTMSGTQKRIVSGMIPVVGYDAPVGPERQAATFPSNTRRQTAVIPAAYTAQNRLIAAGPADATLPGGRGEPSVGYQPLVGILQEGAALQVTPMATTGGKFVVLDVHSRVVLLPDQAAEKRETGMAPQVFSPIQSVAAAIDRPQFAVQHLETTLRVPVDRRMLIGGMTFQIPGRPSEQSLYLFVKLAMQELRDDQPSAEGPVMPAIKTAPAHKPEPASKR
jgi:hypothetical protein